MAFCFGVCTYGKMFMTTDGNKLVREISGLLLACVLALVTLALYSFSPQDPGFNHQAIAGHKIHNFAGIVGAYLASVLVDLAGGAAWLFPIFLALGTVSLFFSHLKLSLLRWTGLFLLAILAPMWMHYLALHLGLSDVGMSGGGFAGRTLSSLILRFFGVYGHLLVMVCLTLVAFRLLAGVSFRTFFDQIFKSLSLIFSPVTRLRVWYNRFQEQRSAPKVQSPPTSQASRTRRKEAQAKVVAAPQSSPSIKKEPGIVSAQVPVLPPMDLLAPVPSSQPRVSQSVLDRQAQALTTCFAEFGIQGEVQGAQPGPVITMFEFKPAPGIKVSRIANMSDDLALALKARAVRIVAPLPGRDTVGIEIPNEKRQIVYLREILDDPVFLETRSQLPLALGKDSQGNPKIADLAKMPHMLVAGATGAGKSVCLNCLLLSLVYKHDPDHVKLLLVDPKRIELAVYGTLPHLVHPVVTDMHLAKNALEWAVYEMEQRYEAMARTGVRHITTYNQKLAEYGAKLPEEFQDLKPFPYLVIVIDELADLMMTAAKEVEGSIVRLAQLARASGIHLILATQRPSVDVVTGIIKANFPSRIAFQVSSKHDSRTILDSIGAEYLLGQGDMLFKLSGGGLQRIHGAFVGDDEIARVVSYWEQLRPQLFDLDFADWNVGGENGGDGGPGNSDVLDDPKYAEAMAFVQDQGRASISMIQRRLRIGFNRAARFIEQMEADGLIGPQEGSKPRLVRRKD